MACGAGSLELEESESEKRCEFGPRHLLIILLLFVGIGVLSLFALQHKLTKASRPSSATVTLSQNDLNPGGGGQQAQPVRRRWGNLSQPRSLAADQVPQQSDSSLTPLGVESHSALTWDLLKALMSPLAAANASPERERAAAEGGKAAKKAKTEEEAWSTCPYAILVLLAMRSCVGIKGPEWVDQAVERLLLRVANGPATPPRSPRSDKRARHGSDPRPSPARNIWREAAALVRHLQAANGGGHSRFGLTTAVYAAKKETFASSLDEACHQFGLVNASLSDDWWQPPLPQNSRKSDLADDALQAPKKYFLQASVSAELLWKLPMCLGEGQTAVRPTAPTPYAALGATRAASLAFAGDLYSALVLLPAAGQGDDPDCRRSLEAARQHWAELAPAAMSPVRLRVLMPAAFVLSTSELIGRQLLPAADTFGAEMLQAIWLSVGAAGLSPGLLRAENCEPFGAEKPEPLLLDLASVPQFLFLVRYDGRHVPLLSSCVKPQRERRARKWNDETKEGA